jgi:hypothetical protein
MSRLSIRFFIFFFKKKTAFAEFVVAVVVPAFEVCQRSFPSCSSTVELVSRERGALEQLMLADFRKIANVSQLLQFEW